MRRFAICAVAILVSARAFAGDVTVINDKVFFPEGPVMVGDKLLYVEYGANRATMWDGTSNTEFWHQDGCGPSAIIPFGDDYAVTCYDSGSMAVVSKDGKTLASYAKDDAGKPLVGPNDGAPDGKGGIYFTASGPFEPKSIDGRVYHMSSDGTIHEVADDAQQANGVTLSPDGQQLYVNESIAGRINIFKVAADGSLSDRKMFLVLGQLEGEAPNANPDAIKFGPDGNIYIGEASSGHIVKVDPKGQLLHRFEVPSAAAPNFTFSLDAKTIYIMAVDDMSAAPYPGKVYALPNR